MASGDRLVKELCPPITLSDTATAVVENEAGFVTQITSIWVTNTGTEDRKVTLYKNGTSTSNILAAGISFQDGATTILKGSVVLESTQSLYAKQDNGTDVNISCYGIIEEL